MSRILKYNSVKQSLLQYIIERGLPIGTRLPSERALCTRFGVSNLTLRHAEDELCESGMLQREEGRGVFVASTWKGKRLRLGFLSIDVPTYPTEPIIRSLSDMLDAYQCDLQVLYAHDDVQSWLVDEMSRMDFLVVSGFLTPEWITVVRSLGKPVLQLGRANQETGFPRVESDFRDAFRLAFTACQRKGIRRFLVWEIEHEKHSNSIALSQALEEAMHSCGLTSNDLIVDEIRPNSMQSCVDSLIRNKDKFDAIVLRDYMLNYLVFHGAWRSLTGNCPMMVITCEMWHIDEFEQLPDIYVINPQRSTSSIVCMYFFRWQCRLPGKGEAYMEAWEFSRPPFKSNHFELSMP